MCSKKKLNTSSISEQSNTQVGLRKLKFLDLTKSPDSSFSQSISKGMHRKNKTKGIIPHRSNRQAGMQKKKTLEETNSLASCSRQSISKGHVIMHKKKTEPTKQ